MAKVAVLLAPGFEEAEAIITIDILRRMQIEVEMLACAESRAVVSYHNIPMVADSTLTERKATLYDAVVLPGGPQGSVNLAASEEVVRFVAAHDEAGKLICPICSAAARVLGGNQLLKGRRYVCSGIYGKRCRMASTSMLPSWRIAIFSAERGWVMPLILP